MAVPEGRQDPQDKLGGQGEPHMSRQGLTQSPEAE